MSLYLIEIPFTIYVFGHLNVWAQILTIVIPTLLMFLLVTTIKQLSVNNYRLVIEKTQEIIAGDKNLYEVDIYPKKNIFFNILTAFVYFINICISAAVYGLFLYHFSFPPLSSFLFIAFTALILFAGIKIRRRARELHTEPKKDGFLTIIQDILSLPILRFDHWLSNYWKKYNIVSITFNFLIEMPFFTFINFIENWRYFIKEKKKIYIKYPALNCLLVLLV